MILAPFEINIDKKLLKLEFYIYFLRIMSENSNYMGNYFYHTGHQQNVSNSN